MPLPLDAEELKHRVRAGEIFSLRHFYGHAARENGRISNAVFSQFYPCRFEIDGETFRWAEQWMMAGKAHLFGDHAARKKIMAAPSAQDCKQLGREVGGYDDDRWAAERFDLVTRGNGAKFGQDDVLKDYLLSTGDDVLVEAAPHDLVWGIGLGRDDTGANDPLAWPGLNLLGFAIVRARGILLGE